MSDVETFDVTEVLVHQLLVDQHPDLADLPIHRSMRGWDNAVFRLGDGLALRIPQRVAGAVLIGNERAWLPTLLTGVPDFEAGGLDASVHLRDGHPARGYPWDWAILAWHDGDVAAHTPPTDPMDAARRLGRFCAALHRDAPADAPDNPWRGGPLTGRAAMLPEQLDRVAARGRSLGEGVDRGDVEAAFAEAAGVAADTGQASWLHGDLHLGNLIVRDGQLRAAIDFGDITSGDRATDLSVAWSLFATDPDARPEFRTCAGAARPVDDATWTRARAWAIALNVAYLQGEFTTPERLDVAQRGLAAALTGP